MCIHMCMRVCVRVCACVLCMSVCDCVVCMCVGLYCTTNLCLGVHVGPDLTSVDMANQIWLLNGHQYTPFLLG